MNHMADFIEGMFLCSPIGRWPLLLRDQPTLLANNTKLLTLHRWFHKKALHSHATHGATTCTNVWGQFRTVAHYKSQQQNSHQLKKGQNVMQHFLSILSLAKLENISRKPRDSHAGRHPKNLFAAVQTSMTGNPAWIYLYTQRITRLLHV